MSPSSPTRPGSWIAAGLLLIGLALRLGLAWQDHHILLSEWVWSDDAYLSLSVARNLALGQGMTSDGTHVTNGFQPLYVFLMVPVYLLVSPDNLVLPVHIAGTLLAVAGTAAAGMFYLIARRLYSRTAALCVLFFFTISHYFVATDVNGLETALYGLTLSAMLHYYLTRFTGAQAASGRQCAMLGVLAGATMLARVDAGVVLVCIAVHFAWHRRRDVGLLLKRAAAGTGAFVATMAPWWVTSVILCDAVLPVSGPAVRFLAIQNGWKPVSNLVGHTGPERFVDDVIPWHYYANNVLHLAGQVIAFLPPTAHAQGFDIHASLPRALDSMPIGRALARAPWIALAIIMVTTIAALFVPVWTARRRKPVRRPTVGDVAFLRFAIVGWLGAYAFYLLCPWYSHRYLYPVVALLTVGSGAVLNVFFEKLDKRRLVARYTVLVSGAMAYLLLFVTHVEHYYPARRSPGEPDRYTPVLPWIRENVPPEAVIGSFQSGVLSYFLPNRCVNLDGVVNAEALAAMHEHRLWDYLRSERVDYVVDWPICIDSLLNKFGGAEPVPLKKVYSEYAMDVYAVGGTQE